MKFRDNYYFLSNMYPCNVPYTHKGVLYNFKCSEALFQALKSKDLQTFKTFEKLNGFEAKALGRKIPLREDWATIKVKAMKIAIYCKFENNKDLQQKLLAIQEPIVEENTWNDTFWGVCKGKGLNKLGRLLMAYRQYLRKEVK
jgi:ribA/ribD-fused uncharacterized protein